MIRIIGILLPAFVANVTQTQTGTRDRTLYADKLQEFNYTISVDAEYPSAGLTLRLKLPACLDYVSHEDLSDNGITFEHNTGAVVIKTKDTGDIVSIRLRAVSKGIGKVRMSAEYRIGKAKIADRQRIVAEVLSVNRVEVKE